MAAAAAAAAGSSAAAAAQLRQVAWMTADSKMCFSAAALPYREVLPVQENLLHGQQKEEAEVMLEKSRVFEYSRVFANTLNNYCKLVKK